MGGRPRELKQLWESLERQKGFALEEKIEAISGDRGYASKAASKRLQAEGIFDALTPRNPQELKERMEAALCPVAATTREHRRPDRSAQEPPRSAYVPTRFNATDFFGRILTEL